MHAVFENAINAISALRDRTISTVVNHSETARQLEGLKGRFDELSERMNSVVQEAQRFRQDLHMTMTERDKYKKDAEDNLALANSYEQERNEARSDLNTVRADRAQAEADLADSNRKLEAANSSIIRLGSDIKFLHTDRDNWRNLAGEASTKATIAEKALTEANQRLSKMQGFMRELFPESPKAEVPTIKTYAEAFPGERPSTSDADLVNEAPKFDPPPVQSAGDHGVNERIDDYAREGEKPVEEKPLLWWEKDKVTF